ncbi:hypothetical protein Pla110_36380 [Polystyrenella longa]|uniref:Fimbrial assembly protein (PilN) n=1 Tax=Polystyrenella longa TaxID=2528007 RepID=A0A518CRN0_9PLAN|nr:PilN domain-containing protein [Polystyrenella longa]QDU81887.1 hypothetical protein Pla110_36380 [Polystyrenella longa]
MQNINLLPIGFLKRSLIRIRLKQWGAVMFLLWGGLIFYYIVHRAEIEKEARLVEQMQLDVKPIQQHLDETEYSNGEINKLRKRQQLGMGLEQKNIPLQTLGKVSEAAAARAGDLYLTIFRLSTTSNSRQQMTRTASDSPEETRDPTEMSLQLDGLAMDDLTITGFIADMSSTGLFHSVELISIAEQQIDDRKLRIFKIECQL